MTRMRFDPILNTAFHFPDEGDETAITDFINEQRRSAGAIPSLLRQISGMTQASGSGSILPKISPSAAWGMTPEQFAMLNQNMMADAKQRQDAQQQQQEQNMRQDESSQRMRIAQMGVDLDRERMANNERRQDAAAELSRQEAMRPKILGSPRDGIYAATTGEDGKVSLQTILEAAGAPVVRDINGVDQMWDAKAGQFVAVPGAVRAEPKEKAKSGGGSGGSSKDAPSQASVNTILSRLVDGTGEIKDTERSKYTAMLNSPSFSEKDKNTIRTALQLADEIVVKNPPKDDTVEGKKPWYQLGLGTGEMFTHKVSEGRIFNNNDAPAANQTVIIDGKKVTTDAQGYLPGKAPKENPAIHATAAPATQTAVATAAPAVQAALVVGEQYMYQGKERKYLGSGYWDPPVRR